MANPISTGVNFLKDNKKFQGVQVVPSGGGASTYATRQPDHTIRYQAPSGDVLGASTMGGGGGGGGGGSAAPAGGDVNGDAQKGFADASYQSALQAIRDRLAMLTGESDRLNGVAKGVRDEVLGNIGTTYAGVNTAADTQKTNALGALAENDRGVVRDYANTQGALNASAEGTVNKNRALARALGYGNSSYYQDTQDKARTDQLDKTAGLQNEGTAKLTAIKGKVADTNTWHAQKKVEIAQEEASLKAQAEREYQDQVAQNSLMARSGTIDSVDAGNQALAQYQSKLDAIGNYIGTKANQVATVASKAGAQASNISSYNPVAAIQGVLGNTAGISAANTGVASTIGSGAASPTSGAAGRPLTALPNKSVLDQYLYPQPLYA